MGSLATDHSALVCAFAPPGEGDGPFPASGVEQVGHPAVACEPPRKDLPVLEHDCPGIHSRQVEVPCAGPVRAEVSDGRLTDVPDGDAPAGARDLRRLRKLARPASGASQASRDCSRHRFPPQDPRRRRIKYPQGTVRILERDRIGDA